MKHGLNTGKEWILDPARRINRARYEGPDGRA